MRKIGIFLLILMMVSTSLSAAVTDGGALFRNVPGEALSESEMAEAEGEGFFTVLLGGAAFGALTYLADCMSRSTKPTWKGAATSASVGAIAAVSPVIGALAGLGVVAGSSFRVGSHYLQHQL